MGAATDISYGCVVTVDLSVAGAVAAVEKAFAAEGFQIVSDIDMEAKVKERLGQTFRPYRILGVCNAQLAKAALSVEPQLGLLVPCNVVVQEIDRRVIVSAIDVNLIVQAAGNRSLEHVAADANARLKRALNAIAR